MPMLLATAFTSACILVGSPALVATEVIRAGDVVHESNTRLADGASFEDGDELIGREVKRTVYKDQPIDHGDTRAPRLINRNQLVTVKYIKSGLEISITGRAMGDASLGEQVSVMNNQSRQLVNGTVTKDGWILAQ